MPPSRRCHGSPFKRNLLGDTVTSSNVCVDRLLHPSRLRLFNWRHASEIYEDGSERDDSMGSQPGESFLVPGLADPIDMRVRPRNRNKSYFEVKACTGQLVTLPKCFLEESSKKHRFVERSRPRFLWTLSGCIRQGDASTVT